MAWIQTGSTICFKPYSLDEALAGLAAAGFENVEIGAVKDFLEHLDPDDLAPATIASTRSLLEVHGLRVVSMSGHAPLHLELGRDRLRRVLHAGAELGILVLNTFTGDAETEDERAAFFENVREIADEAKELGITLCIETDSNLMPTAEAGVQLLAEIGHDWIRINYDPGNVVYYAGVSPEEDIKHALGLLDHDAALRHPFKAEQAEFTQARVDVGQDVDGSRHFGERVTARVERIDDGGHEVSRKWKGLGGRSGEACG